ncbi:MAG: hypothetical protein QXI56_08665 [Candidatus Bathyarchaeia archaeon]
MYINLSVFIDCFAEVELTHTIPIKYYYLKSRASRSNNFNKKLSLWFYRRIQYTINYEALERRLETTNINPRIYHQYALDLGRAWEVIGAMLQAFRGLI